MSKDEGARLTQEQAADIRRSALHEAIEANCRWCSGVDGKRWKKIPASDGWHDDTIGMVRRDCHSSYIWRLLDIPYPAERTPAPPSDARHGHCPACMMGQVLESGQGTHLEGTIEHPVAPVRDEVVEALGQLSVLLAELVDAVRKADAQAQKAGAE